MLIELPELAETATLSLGRHDRLDDDAYFEFCMANPDLNFERTAEGEIVIVPPAGWESDNDNFQVIVCLGEWARKDGRGKGSGSSTQFFLPDGSALGPDAAWISNERLATLNRTEKRRFVHLVPEFIVEVMSPSDRLSSAKKKMRRWMANGVELGWLIDGDHRTVYVYRGKEEPRVVVNTESLAGESLAGEGPVEGFLMPLTEIRKGL